MIRFIILAGILFLYCGVSSQVVTGSIRDPAGRFIAFSPVALLNEKDNTVYKGTISDENGTYFFRDLKPGNYILKFAVPGFEERAEMPFLLDSNQTVNAGVIHLKNSKGVNLDEISISTVKRTVEFKKGNITVNVENSALAAGNTAYDLLLKLPGVSINDETISIQGRAGVKIMINDRILQMSPKQLVTLLKSMSGASIEKIEVLKNPPVKYDAAGTAGLINIRTKKTKVTGFSGTAVTSGSQGFYSRGESSFSLNYKTKKLILFCDVASEYGKYIYEKKFRRILVSNSSITELDEHQVQKENVQALQPTAGLDWQVNKKLLVGTKVTVGPGSGTNRIPGNYVVDDPISVYNRITYNNSMSNTWNYMNFNINAEYAFDTIGTKLSFSTDYSPNWDKYTGAFDHHFLKNSDEVTAPLIFKTFLKENIHLLSSKLDLEKHLSETGTLQAGLKYGNQELRKEYLFENKNLQDNNYINDTSLSNHFSYSEKIVACYINFEKELENFEISAGLRAENTSIRMKSQDKNFSAIRSYFNLFPVLSIGFDLNEKNDFQMSCNNRINRPDGYSYYPNRVFDDNFLISEMGNTALLPEYSNTLEFTHVYKKNFSNALAYSYIHNYLFNYTLQNDSTKELTVYTANLKNSQTISYTFFCERKIKNWWILSGNITLSHLTFKGKVNDLDYSSSGVSSNALLRNELVTGKTSKLEVGVWFYGPQPSGVILVKPKWAFNIAFKKKLLKDKLDVVIGIDDLFYTQVDRMSADFQTQRWSIRNTSDTKRIKMSFSYSFGSMKIERREINDNEEERERLKH